MSEPATPSEGLGVLHLFCKVGPLADADLVREAVGTAESSGDHASMLGGPSWPRSTCSTRNAAPPAPVPVPAPRPAAVHYALMGPAPL